MAQQPVTAAGGLGQMAAGAPQATPRPAAGAPPSSPLGSQVAMLEQADTTVGAYKDKTVQDLQRQREALTASIQQLRSSLDTRLPFDPMMMRVAAGFLQPTKTGSFGESAGYAMEGAAKGAEEQYARQQATNKQKLEFDTKLMELNQQQAIASHQARRTAQGAPVGVGPSVGGASSPSAGGPSVSETAGSSAPVGSTGQAKRYGAPRQLAMITDRDVADAFQLSPAYGEQVLKQAKEEREKFISTPQGLFDRSTETYVKATPHLIGTVKTRIPGFGEVEITQAQAQGVTAAIQEANRVGSEKPITDYYRSQGFMEMFPPGGGQSALPAGPAVQPGAGSAVPPTSQEGQPPPRNTLGLPSRPRTQAEVDIEKAADIKRQEGLIQEDSDQRVKMNLSRDTAQERVTAANTIYSLASNPETQRVFDMFNTGKVRDVIVAALRGPDGGIKTTLGSIDIKNIQDAMVKAKATEKELSAAQVILRSQTMMNLQDTISLMAKQGQITEGERALIAQLNPSVWQDTRRSAMAKSQLVKARAEYDLAVSKDYNEWRDKNPKSYIDDYRQGKGGGSFKTLYGHYDKVTADLANKYFPKSVGAPSSGFENARPAGRLESQIR